MILLQHILATFILLAFCTHAAAQWRANILAVPGLVTAIDTSGTDIRIAIGESWYRLPPDSRRLEAVAGFEHPAPPPGALPDARVAVSADRTTRAWLADPTTRYPHGVLGDAIEAGSLIVERRHGRTSVLRLAQDAVFEDIVPRFAILGGTERILVVKSYLDRGSALAIVDTETAAVIAETPPIGRPNAWLNPAGVADYNGDGTVDIALVRQPHIVGRLELWSWRSGKLDKIAEVSDVSNHAIGSRALEMSVTADFDSDGRPDLAVPSLDRRSLRLIGFAPQPSDIARVPLPARMATNIGSIRLRSRVALVAGLETGELVLIHD